MFYFLVYILFLRLQICKFTFLLRIYAKPRSNIKLSSPVFSSIQTEYRNISFIFYRKIWYIETSFSLLLYVICFISAFIYYILSHFYFSSVTKKFLIKVFIDNLLCPPYISVKGKPLVKVYSHYLVIRYHVENLSYRHNSRTERSAAIGKGNNRVIFVATILRVGYFQA